MVILSDFVPPYSPSIKTVTFANQEKQRLYKDIERYKLEKHPNPKAFENRVLFWVSRIDDWIFENSFKN